MHIELPSSPRISPPEFPFAGGTVSSVLRKRDWSRSPLGNPGNWPPTLKTAVELCLASPFPIGVLWGPAFLFFFNDAYLPQLNGKGLDALGEPFFSFWGSARDSVRETVLHVYRTGESVLLKDLLIRIDPQAPEPEVTFDVSYSPIRGPEGRIEGLYVVGYENTQRTLNERRWQMEQARMEEAFARRTDELIRSRAFLDSLIENLPNMVFVKDAKELRFVRFNRAGEDLLGIHRSELIGKNDYDFFPAEQADHFTARDRDVLAGREIVDIPEEPIATRKGGTRYLHTRKIPVLGADGTPEYLLGISDDITDKREAEAERLRLSREEAALSEREAANARVALLAESGVALASSLDYRVSLQRLSQLVVPGLADWCSILVREPDGRFSRIAAEHADPARRALVDELVATLPGLEDQSHGSGFVIRAGTSEFRPVITDDMLVRLAQNPRELEVLRALEVRSSIVVPIRGRESVHGTIALVTGESQREYNEDDLRTAEDLGRRAGAAIDNALLYRETQMAVASRDVFLSIASHELKTPLTSLTIQAQMRRRQLDRGNVAQFSPDRVRQMVESDARQLDRLNRLIDDMLDISRINTGKLAIHPEPVNLLQLAREVADRHADQYAKAGCEISVRGDDHVIGLWDRFRIEQVVTNLLSNALKYGAGRPVEILVRDHGREASLEVQDHGIGIAPEDRDRIFRQFERAGGASEVSGLGLGLYIVHQILELHGGSVRVESTVGRGSRFIVTLPTV